MLGDLRADVALPREHQANGLNHFGQTGALGHVSRRAGLQQPCGKRVFFAHRDRHHLHVGVAADELARGFQSADAGHLDVHQHDIGFQLAGLLQRLFAGLGLSHHLQAFNVGQHARDTCPNQIVVIDNQHPNQADTSPSNS